MYMFLHVKISNLKITYTKSFGKTETPTILHHWQTLFANDLNNISLKSFKSRAK